MNLDINVLLTDFIEAERNFIVTGTNEKDTTTFLTSIFNNTTINLSIINNTGFLENLNEKARRISCFQVNKKYNATLKNLLNLLNMQEDRLIINKIDIADLNDVIESMFRKDNIATMLSANSTQDAVNLINKNCNFDSSISFKNHLCIHLHLILHIANGYLAEISELHMGRDNEYLINPIFKVDTPLNPILKWTGNKSYLLSELGFYDNFEEVYNAKVYKIS